MEWISVKNKDPKFSERVLVYGNITFKHPIEYQSERIVIAYSSKGNLSNDNHWVMENPDHTADNKDITHWMPLQEPSKE